MNRLGEFLPGVPILALTATADEATKEDIVNQLNLVGQKVFLNSFDRPNIHYSVRPRKKEKEQLLSYVQTQGNATGIIYCLSRKKTEEIAQYLKDNGFRATHYHAGLTAQEREERQGAFKNDYIQIIVATIAFGMGIDKPNVRFVVHLNLPKNMESYYQETGRAGRDGEESEAVLFYKSADFSLLAGFFEKESEDQKNLLLNKLRRMGDFADAYTCRRKILLQYFNEPRASDMRAANATIATHRIARGTEPKQLKSCSPPWPACNMITALHIPFRFYAAPNPKKSLPRSSSLAPTV